MAEVALDGMSPSASATSRRCAIFRSTIADGEFVVLLGPTGAGKTTTLRLIAGLERPDAGRVSIDGHDVTARAAGGRDVAFVFQQYSLYPHLTVYDNLAFPLRSPARRMPEAEIAQARPARSPSCCTSTASSTTARRACPAARCSASRSAARWCARRPIYLMDEPLSSLDAKLRAELRLELKRIQVELGATILYVTHDQIEAMTMASRIGVIREGSLVQVGTPREIYESPNNLYVATRLGTPRDQSDAGRALAGAAAPAARADRRRRAPSISRIGKAERRRPRRARPRVEHLGDQNHLHLEIDGHALVTLADPHRRSRQATRSACR